MLIVASKKRIAKKKKKKTNFHCTVWLPPLTSTIIFIIYPLLLLKFGFGYSLYYQDRTAISWECWDINTPCIHACRFAPKSPILLLPTIWPGSKVIWESSSLHNRDGNWSNWICCQNKWWILSYIIQLRERWVIGSRVLPIG